jgi:hypothetical protein
MDPVERTQEEATWRAEAERLKLLDRETQRDLVRTVRNLALSPKLTQAERAKARRRAAALGRMLRIR